MNALAARLASHVQDFGESWQVYASAEYHRLVSLQGNGAATAEQVEAARLVLDLATCVVSLAREVINANMPAPPP